MNLASLQMFIATQYRGLFNTRTGFKQCAH